MNRYKTIKKAFKPTTDHNQKSGNDRKTCSFFESLQDIEGDRPKIIPDFTIHPMGKLKRETLL